MSAWRERWRAPTRWVPALLIAVATGLGIWLVTAYPEWAWALRERAERGAKFRTIDYVRAGCWWATLANGLLLLALAFSARAWMRASRARPVQAHLTGAMWVIVGGAMVVGGWFRAERLDLSLYADEAYTLRSYVLGRWRADASGEAKFHAVDWLETFFQEHEASNHVPFSALSRVGLAFWRASGAPEGSFDPRVFRWPSFVFGLATIPLLAWLGGLLGFPRGGVLAAVLLALHPWHIRYSSEARGYAMAMAFAVLATALLVRGLRGGAWRDWIGFGLAQWLLVWTYPGSLYLAVTLNLAALAALLAGDRAALPRWVVGGVMGVMAGAWSFGPDLPQIVEYLRLERARGEMGIPWLQNFVALLLAGAHWRSPDPEHPILMAVANGPGASASGQVWVAVAAPALVTAGAVLLCRREGRVGAAVAGALVLAAPLGYLHASRAGNFLFLWYLIFVLPGLVLLLAIGATGGWRRPSAALAAGLVAAGWFASVSHPQREVIRRHAKEPLLDVVQFVHEGADPFERRGRSGPILACFWSNAPAHDPWMVYVWKPVDLVLAMERSLRDARPLYLTYGHRERAEQTVPHLLALADDPELFQPVRTFHGLEEPQFTHRLLRFRGNAEAVARLRARWGHEEPSPNTGYSKSSG